MSLFLIIVTLSVVTLSNPAFAKAKKGAEKPAAAVLADVKEVNLHVEKVGEIIHWLPDTIEVTRGEKVKFVLTNNFEGPIDVHGFSIPILKLLDQVKRGTPKTIEVTIPADLKPGEYPIICQIHPKHAQSKLIVK